MTLARMQISHSTLYQANMRTGFKQLGIFFSAPLDWNSSTINKKPFCLSIPSLPIICIFQVACNSKESAFLDLFLPDNVNVRVIYLVICKENVICSAMASYVAEKRERKIIFATIFSACSNYIWSALPFFSFYGYFPF